MAWIAELTGYDTTAGALKTLRFAMGAGVALLDSYAPSGLLKWSSPSQKLDVGKDGRVAMSADAGEVTILNAPAAVDQPGPWDALADWSWRNRSARLYWVPALDWSARVLTQQGVLEQPVADLQGRTLTFRLRDPRAALDVPLQPSKYAGSNVGPAGIEGLADLKGRAKPVLYGRVSNITPPRVNESLLIYQVADKAATVDCVRDGGTALTVGTVRASLASMQANDPGPGKYDTYVGAEGAFFRLGSAPQFALTCDVYEGATAADRTHAQIWKRIRKERCGNVDADLDAAALVAADALDAGEAGFWWFEDASRRDALDEVLGGFSGYELLQLNQTWTMAKLVAPSGSPVIELEQLTPATKLKATSRKLTGLTRVRPTYLPDGVPPYRANVNWGRNYTVMAESDFAGAAVQRLRDKFATDWRTETATDLTVWNPATLTGPWPDAPELTIDTGYAVGVDGLTCPAAAAEATRLLTLYGGARSGYQAGFVPRAGDMIAPGSVVKLKHPQYGLSGGLLFRVLQSGFVLSGSNEVTAELVLGLGISPPAAPAVVPNYAFVGAAQTALVPAGKTSATVTMWGGAGGNGNWSSGAWSGAGGYVQATFPVSPGDVLKFEVGGGGQGAARNANGGAGGWPDGGPGGRGDSGSGGGGGSSRFYINDVLMAVAAGGGGSGGLGGAGSAGAGGGATGQAGFFPASSGTGGSQAAGGWDAKDTSNANKTGRSIVAFPGAQRTGGFGSANGDPTTLSTDDGGGGGGGYWGGGGGGGDSWPGGGGSSWTHASATGVTNTAGNRQTPAGSPPAGIAAGVNSAVNGPAVPGGDGYISITLS